MLWAGIWLVAVASSPTSSLSSEPARLAWFSCLDKFSDAGAATIDQAPTIADAAFLYCKGEAEKFEKAWVDEIVKESVFKPTRQDTEAKAISMMADWRASKRDDLIVRIQMRRQLLAVQEEGKRLRER